MKKRSAYIAVTSYTGQIETKTAHSITANCCELITHGYNIHLDFHIGDCYITQARNALVDRFLKSKYTDIIMVDWDIAFPRDLFVRLMQHKPLFVGGVYPYRANQPGFPVYMNVTKEGKIIGDRKTGLISCKMIPGGMMRIHRSVFDVLKRKFPKMKAKDNWKFFDSGHSIFPPYDSFVGEDNCFCRRCVSAGIPIWLDPDIDFLHIGRTEYAGNFHKYLKSQEPKAKLK